MSKIRKLEFIFGEIAMTLTEADMDAIMTKLALKHPKRDPTSTEFADACMEHMTANARPARTVLHN
jgi:hypothetical protein